MDIHENIECEETADEESVLAKKQRKEKKELTNKFTALKHALNKNDKKGKKELLGKQAIEEAAMDERHKEELALLKSRFKESFQEEIKNGPSGDDTDASIEHKISKAQKRRELKEKRDRECNERVLEMEEQSSNNERHNERERFKNVLSVNNLVMVEIPADGDCLYNAVSHQLLLLGQKVDAQALRSECANVLRLHQSEFEPFYDHDDVMYTDYCAKVEQTKLWGGNLELRALSTFLKRKINVIQSDGTIIAIKDDKAKCLEDSLNIVYLKHDTQAGAHYNSTMKAN